MAVSADSARRLALSLPEAVEQDHHGFPSFRVGGKIFATMPSGQVLRVMAPPETIAETVESRPGVCFEVFWGKKLSAVGITLAAADAGLVEGLLHTAWTTKAPASLR